MLRWIWIPAVLLWLGSGTAVAQVSEPIEAQQIGMENDFFGEATDDVKETVQESLIDLAVTHLDIARSTGCWATFYTGHDFTGRTLTLMGHPDYWDVDFALRDVPGLAVPKSLIVGPEARLRIYSDAMLVKIERDLEQGTMIADLSGEAIWDIIKLVSLRCTPQE